MRRQCGTSIIVPILLIALTACAASEVAQPTPNVEQTIDVAVRATLQAVPTVTIHPTSTLLPTATVEATPDVPATVAAAVHATIAAILTATPIPTPTPTPTLTPTPAPTATPTPTPTSTPTPAPSPPLRITTQPMTEDRTLDVRLTNVSDTVIVAYELLICPRDRFGEIVPGSGEECFEWDGRLRLNPTGSEPPPDYVLFDEAKPGRYYLNLPIESIGWQTDTYPSYNLQRFETATQATVELLSVGFEDGTVWREGQLFPAQ